MAAPGCYTSHGLAPGAPSPGVGADVSVRLTPAGSVRLAERSGRTERVLRGTLQEDPRDALVLAVRSIQEGRELGGAGLRQVVVVPWADAQEVEVREFSPARTGLMALGGAALAYALARLAFGLADDASDGRVPPPGEVPAGPGLRIPVG